MRRMRAACAGTSGSYGRVRRQQRDTESGQPEIVDQAAIQQLHVAHRAGVVALDRLREVTQQRLRIAVGARARDPLRQPGLAAARIGLEHDRREHHRHRGRGRDRLRDRIVHQVAAHRVERDAAEHERRAVVDVGGVDPDARALVALEVAEGRPAEQIVVEPARQVRGVVQAAADRAAEIHDRNPGVQRLLGVAQQEALAEVAERLAPAQAVVSGEHRPAGDAGHEIDAVEQRYVLAAVADAGAIDLLEHTERERRRARAAAGEGKAHHDVIG